MDYIPGLYNFIFISGFVFYFAYSGPHDFIFDFHFFPILAPLGRMISHLFPIYLSFRVFRMGIRLSPA